MASRPSARTTSRVIRVTVGAVTPSVCRTVAAMPCAIFLPIFGELAEPRLVADLAAEAATPTAPAPSTTSLARSISTTIASAVSSSPTTTMSSA